MCAENPFWAFSLHYYSLPGVQRACIDLQDRHGVNVNLLLLVCWCGVQGLTVTAAVLGALRDDSSLRAWQQQFISPLRTLRRALPGYELPGSEVLRSLLLEAELQAERLEQDQLYAFFRHHFPAESGGPAEPARFMGNVQSLWFSEGLTGILEGEVAPLLAAAFPALADQPSHRGPYEN